MLAAATLRTGTAGSQDESRCSAIHKVKRKSKGKIAYATYCYSIQPPVTLITWPVM